MTCADIQPNLEAYALDALDPITRARVETHLRTCSRCRLAALQLKTVVSELPLALAEASPLRPPTSLKRQVMEAAQAEVQAHAIRETFAPHATPVATPSRRGQWLLRPRVWVPALATMLVLVLVLAGWNIRTTTQMQQALSNEQAAHAQIDLLRHQQELAIPVLNSPTSQQIVLDPTSLAPASSGRLLLEPNKPTIVFVGHNLPQVAPDQKYILWTINKGVIQSVGRFTPNATGFAMVVFLADREDPLLKEVFVTRQAASSIFPSPDRILSWRADPNQPINDVTYGSIFPRPTVIRPDQ
jgi:Putative zinc-finger/Anti-sigma-K factor rskA, C-terminal